MNVAAAFSGYRMHSLQIFLVAERFTAFVRILHGKLLKIAFQPPKFPFVSLWPNQLNDSLNLALGSF